MIEQGKHSEALALIFRLLPRLLGAVNPELERNIRSLSVPQLVTFNIAPIVAKKV